MTQPTGYWCPTCGDVPTTRHTKSDCIDYTIPVFKPLDVPEVTTWGESHPAGAVCAYFEIDDCPYMMLVSGRRFGCIDGEAAAVAGPKVCHDVPDITTAINYVAGAK